MKKETIWSAQDVIDMCKGYMNENHVKFVENACEFDTYVHSELVRKSGEP